MSERLHYDTVALVGDQIRVTLKDGDYVEFSAWQARRVLEAQTLTTDDVRAIVKDEMREAGWSRMGSK